MNALLLLRPDADPARVRSSLLRRGADAELLEGAGQRALLVDADVPLDDIDGVDRVLRASSAHPRVDAAPVAFAVGSALLGGSAPLLMAGPCAVEDEASLDRIAGAVARAGARVLRGGAFKPRTSPYAFQGAGIDGLRMLRAAADRHGLAVVTEALDVRHVTAVAEHADLVQIGSRNMQNYALLREVGAAGRPVLLKRAAAATIEEWLLAAEHLFAAGAPAVALCERGIRAIAGPTRNTLDLGTVAWLLEHAGLPVVVDPSHATGRRELIPRLTRAACALGAHGALIEVHEDPGRAKSDGAQAVPLPEFAQLARDLCAGAAFEPGQDGLAAR